MNEQGVLLHTILFLAAAIVFVPLATRLRLGSVLGYLIAGCAIGPFGLKLVRDVKSTLHFAEIGVVLMLFLIGLELDPKRLWSMRSAVFRVGSMQLAACAAPLAIGFIALGLPWKASVVAGVALGLSSTAIAVQVMAERSALATQGGRGALAVLLFQDMAAIPLIAIVPLLAGGPKGGNIGVAIAKVAAAVVAVIVIGRYLTRPILRVIAATGQREVFTGFALLLVLGIAELMTLAGVSMALGAFLAGVLLAGSEYRHALETDIEPFKGLLLGLFFIAVGMTIDLGLLARSPLLVIALVVAFLVIKVGVLRIVAGAAELPAAERWAFASVLGQGSEFAFVVFGIATRERMMPHEWDALLTLVVALSMALTPLVTGIADRLGARGVEKPPEDVVVDESAPVIIAGFGRYGQIVGRLLFASGQRATVLDNDPESVATLRKFGYRVFYGDATRLDLLRQAGAERAKILVVAIDDIPSSLRLVDLAREHFPALTIIARARNVTHYAKLRARGVGDIQRETFDAALRTARDALVRLGASPYEARELAERFRLHNVTTLETLLPHFSDEARRLSMTVAAREQLEAQFARDRAEAESARDEWHVSPDDSR